MGIDNNKITPPLLTVPYKIPRNKQPFYNKFNSSQIQSIHFKFNSSFQSLANLLRLNLFVPHYHIRN